MSKQPNLPGTAPVKKKQYTEYPGRRCPHAVNRPLPHIKYQIENLPGFRTVLQQTGLSVASTGHSAARRILGAHVKHGTDYAVFVDENGYGGFVPKPGTIPEGARLTNPNICQWALPKPVPTAVVHGVVHGNDSTFPPTCTGAIRPDRPDLKPSEWAKALTAVVGAINPVTFRYGRNVTDETVAESVGLPVAAITLTRLEEYGEPVPTVSPAELIALRNEATSRAEAFLKYAADEETFAARMNAALAKLGA